MEGSLSTTIAEMKAEVERIVLRTVARVDESQPQRMWDVEREVWGLLLSMGAALMTLLLLRQSSLPQAAEYTHNGWTFRLKGRAATMIGTRFGKIPFERAYGRSASNPAGKRDFPLDRALGLAGGFSMGVVFAIGRLCAQMAFAPARATFSDTYGWAPSTRATLRMVDALGAEARPFLEACPAPEDDGEILVMQMDGGGAPMINPSELSRRRKKRRHRNETKRASRRRRKKMGVKPRRTKGAKSKNAKVAFVGAIYTLKQTPTGKEGPVNKRIYATFESHEALAIWMRKEADKRGYGRKRSLFLGDGSEHIWRVQERYFPDAEPCVDWCHIVEKLWSAGQCLHKEGSPELASFIDTQIRRMSASNIDAIVEDLTARRERIPPTGPGNKGRRERLAEVIAHLENNKDRMPYRAFRRAGFDIGTGVIEGAVRNLVRMRLDGPGMRWSRTRAEAVLQLRCILLNGQWNDFGKHLAALQQLRLRSQPVPCTPHLAKAAA